MASETSDNGDSLSHFDFSKSVLVNANNVITDHEPNIQQAKKTCNLPPFASSVFLNLDFIIEAPKAAHVKFSLIKNMHFHLFIGYMAAITFQLKNA